MSAHPSDADHVLFESFRQSHDRQTRNELVLRFQWLARRCASSLSNRGVPAADLIQVAEIGLIKAVERYDPDRGVAFSSFAVPTVLGELRRYFRDATWAVSVPRSAKDQRSKVQSAADRLQHELGREPTSREIADRCGLGARDVAETRHANAVYRCASLEQTRSESGDLIELRSVEAARAPDPLASAELYLETLRAISSLPERSRRIIVWRFYEECTQQEIGERLGVSQVQVSRLLRAALEHLADSLGAEYHDLKKTA